MSAGVEGPLDDQTISDLETRMEGTDPGYLAQVRQAAGRLSQRALGATDAQAALVAVEELAAMDLDPPVGSRYPAVRLVKQAVKTLIRWYLNYFGAQLMGFGQAVAHLGSLIVARTDQLEARTAAVEADLTRLAERVRRLEERRPSA